MGDAIMKRIREKILIWLFAVGMIFSLSGAAKIHQVQMAVGTYETTPKIIIDPGHGGADGGAVGTDGLPEKDINLEIALKLQEILTLHGFDVIMTRTDDRSIHDPDISNLKNQKTSDMHNRLKVMKDNKDAIFISIHQNKFQEESSWGTQVFYSHRQEASKQLAEILQNNFIAFLQPENHRQIKQAENNLFLLYNAEIPAVMVECGFISNPAECAKLHSEDYQNQVAYVIYYSLAEFIQMGSHTSMPQPDSI